MAGTTRLELATSCVTGKRSNQTELRSHLLSFHYSILPFKSFMSRFFIFYILHLDYSTYSMLPFLFRLSYNIIVKRLILFLTLIALNLSINLNAQAIKIGLVENTDYVTVGVSNKSMLIDGNQNKLLMNLDGMTPYKLKYNKNSIAIQINNKLYDTKTNKLIIRPGENGFASVKGKWYRGELVVLNNNKLTVINDIPLEHYLLGVVPSEMPSGWSYEALKAQSIAARSYAVANLGKNGSKGYDLKDNTYDQAYGGASAEKQSTNRAVAETKGIVATYNKRVISAYYCASAGGQTKDSGDVWTKNLPYIRSVDSFDKDVRKNGPGIGMSQHGANNMAKQGYNAYQILTYFYNNIKFGRLDPSWNL